MITLILLVLAFVLFLVAAFYSHPRVNFVAGGLAAWVLSVLLGGAKLP